MAADQALMEVRWEQYRVIHREQCGGVTCMALLYHYGTAGLGAAGECFYTEGMLQVIHTIT